MTESNEAVMMPHHYARFAIEPQFFIVINELDKMRGDVIKRIMRWDAKDGIIDLYKAARELDIYTTYQEQKAEGLKPLEMTFHETPSPLEALKRFLRRNEITPTEEHLDALQDWLDKQYDQAFARKEIERG